MSINRTKENKMKIQPTGHCRKLQVSTLWSLLLICLSSPLVADDFYKWTDDKGVVHYSQRAPQGTEAKKVRTYNTGTRTTPAGKSSEKGEAPEEKTTIEPKLAKKDPALCERAKKDSETLRNRPLVRQNGKILTMDQKNEQIKKLQDIINIHC